MLILESRNLFDLYQEHDTEKYILFPDVVFDEVYEEEWFECEFGHKLLNDVGHLECRENDSVKNRMLALGLDAEHLATGIKNIFLCKYYLEYQRVMLTRMGPNCFPYLFDIAKEKDIYCVVTNYVSFSGVDLHGAEVYFPSLNRLVDDPKMLVDAMIDLAESEVWNT